MYRLTICAVFLLLSFHLSFAQQASNEPVRAVESTLIIPTYPVGNPEVNPIFYTPEQYQGAQMHIYPYPYLGMLSDERTDKKYKAIRLENEYIELVVLPELGGRLYIARDKTNDYDFFYRNRVIKPALIGMVGAWMSGGIEWNIPHHHRASTFMPVDYRIEEKEDGSKTVWVGEYEKRHGTRWAVGLTLHPGKAYVETTMKHFNPTPYHQSILMWANTAVHANEEYQVFFPPDVEKATFHSKNEYTDWPISKQFYRGIDFTQGVDVSLWKNISSPTSFFAWDTQMDFLGGIDHGKKAGTVLVGDHHIFAGKKVWYWGNNDVQRLWDQMLTDEDGPYLELMMGLYSDNQPDYSWSSPFTAKSGTMFTYPIRDLSGLSMANRDVALYLLLREGFADIELLATGVYEEARLLLEDRGRVVLRDTLTLTPDSMVHRRVRIDRNTDPTEVTVKLLDRNGKELVVYTPPKPKKDPVPETYQEPDEPDAYETADELYLTGLRLEQFGNPHLDPVKYYEAALEIDQKHILTNTQLGIWYLKKGLNQRAEQRLRVAVDEVTGNHTRAKYGEPLYYLGVTLLHQARLDEAYDVLYDATWNQEWASPAYYLLAAIDGRRGDFERALDHVRRAVTANGNNTDAQVLHAALVRRAGDKSHAAQILQDVLSKDPLNLTAQFERYLLDPSGIHPGRLVDLFRAETDNYLETAARYGLAGLYTEAVELLRLADESHIDRLSQSPMIFYYLGYFEDQLGNDAESREAYAKAAALPIELVFPYGHTSNTVLRAAIEQNPNDAHAQYLLGNVLADHEPEEAIALWEQAAALDTVAAVYHRNMAYIQANILDDVQNALANIEEAVQRNPTDPRVLWEADQYKAYARVAPEERLQYLTQYADTVAKWDKLVLRQISLLNMAGRYDESIDSLKNTHFYVAEISHINPHEEWTNAHLYRGIRALADNKRDDALADFQAVFEFPRNLEIVRDNKIGAAHYWMARAYEADKKPEAAAEQLRTLMSFRTEEGWGGQDAPLVRFYTGLAYRALGDSVQAQVIFDELIEDGTRGLNREMPDGIDLRGVRVRQDIQNRMTEAWFSSALGHFGKGETEEAQELFRKVLEKEPAHIDAYNFLNNEEMLRLLQP